MTTRFDPTSDVTIFLVWTRPATALATLARRGYGRVVTWGTDGDLALWTVETDNPYPVVAILDRLASVVQYVEGDDLATPEQISAWIEDYRGWRNPLLLDAAKDSAARPFGSV
jgi:hypothetical protein